ncbi:hypothetical protein GIS00_26215 [Nakamurella sp. YIM 132087]|uniref:Uncharacterized protein n=1 Tax=Nakamurella alba TaxID=2665158 RepID=A0A7K1FTE7_9ACTN|nr:PGPGW domain-containing protein [Nakamurella alba]MTD17432.1 hypothetical protein [Nakamurella alba]
MKRTVIAVLGGVLTLVGIALLVLPGPGFLLIAAGLAVLGTQFEWAHKPLEYAKVKAEQGIDEVGRSPWRTVGAVLCALALGGVGVLDLLGLSVPFVNTLSAVLLIISGLILLGTIVYAWRKAKEKRNRQEADAAAA